MARIEAHYFGKSRLLLGRSGTVETDADCIRDLLVNGGFIREGQLLEKEQIDKIRHIPATIVQGRYDVVCPAKTAWDLHKGTLLSTPECMRRKCSEEPLPR